MTSGAQVVIRPVTVIHGAIRFHQPRRGSFGDGLETAEAFVRTRPLDAGESFPHRLGDGPGQGFTGDPRGLFRKLIGVFIHDVERRHHGGDAESASAWKGWPSAATTLLMNVRITTGSWLSRGMCWHGICAGEVRLSGAFSAVSRGSA